MSVGTKPWLPPTLLAAAFLLTLLAPLAPAQTAPTFAVLEVTGVATSSPFIRDGLNELNGTIRNAGSVPLRVQAAFDVKQGGSVLQTVPATGEAFVLMPTESRTVDATWTGNGIAAPGLTTITLRAQADDLASAQGSVDRQLVLADLVPTLVTGPSGQLVPGERWAGWLTVNVQNAGNVALDPHLSLTDVPAGWIFELAPAQLPSMQPGEVDQVRVHITPPATAAPNTVAHPTLVARAAPEHAPIRTLALDSPPVATGGIVQLDLQGVAELSIAPGQSGNLTVRLQNRQNFADSLSIAGVPPTGAQGQTLRVEPAAPQSLAPGAAAAINVIFDVTGDLDSAPAGTYAWTLQARRASGEVVAVAPLTIKVSEVRKPTVAIVSSPATVVPGTDYVVTLRLGNAGNLADVVRLAASNLPAGWPAQAPDPVPLASGSTSSTLTWRAKVPSSSPAGLVTLRLAGQSGNGQQGDPAFATVRVESQPFPSTTVDQDRKPLPATGPVQYKVRFANLGNAQGSFVADAAILQQAPNGWGVSAINPSQLTLAPGQSVDVTVNVTRPAGALAASDGAKVRVRLTESGGLARSSAVELLASPASPDLALRAASPLTTPGTPFKDAAGSLSVVVENLGTAPTTRPVELKVTYRTTNGQVRDTKTKEVPALSYEASSRATVISVPLPTTGFSGLLNVTVEVDALHDADERNETNNILQRDVLVRSFDLDITAPADRLARPGERITFDGASAFVVRNPGTRTESVRITANVTNDWGQLDQAYQVLTFTMAPGATRQVSLNLSLPQRPLAESAHATLRVSQADVPEVFVQRTVRIQVLDNSPPRITDVQAPSVATLGVPVTVKATILDATGLKEADLRIVAPDGQVASVPMQGDQVSGHYSATYIFQQMGTHKVHVSARDASRNGNHNDTSAAPLVVNVLATHGPTLRLLSPLDNTSVKPATPLAIAVFGGTPLRSATATVNGQDVPLALTNPLQVRTENLPEGPLAVRIAVEDEAGFEAAAIYNVRLDGSSPVVSEIRIVEPDPKPGQEVTVTAVVEDASPLTKLTLRVQRTNARITDVPMAINGTLATATFEYPDGLSSLSVVAQDLAGNVGVEERPYAALLGAATKESPGLPFALLAVVALAAAFARRRP